MPPGRERYRFRDRDEWLLARRAVGSQREVAELAGMRKSFLGELESGRKAACSRAIAAGLARALGQKVERLFVRVNQAPPAGAEEREVS